jgi:hypothetical protein
LWENEENAEAYNRGAYPEVTKILARVVEGTPQVETYEVANSTFHKIAAAVAAQGRQVFSFGGGRAKYAPSLLG